MPRWIIACRQDGVFYLVMGMGICGLGWMVGPTVWAIAFGTALSPSVEPLRVSLASPLQSLSQGEVR